MKKLILSFLIIGFITTTVFGVFNIINSDSSNELVELTDAELIELIQHQENEFFVYVGRPTCYFCSKFRPTVETAIESINFDFYSFNTDYNRDNDYFEKVLEYLTITSIPFLIKIRNGEVVDMHGYADGNSVEHVQSWIENVKSNS